MRRNGGRLDRPNGLRSRSLRSEELSADSESLENITGPFALHKQREKMSSVRKQIPQEQIPFYKWFLGLLSMLFSPEASATRDACDRAGEREDRWWHHPSELL